MNTFFRQIFVRFGGHKYIVYSFIKETKLICYTLYHRFKFFMASLTKKLEAATNWYWVKESPKILDRPKPETVNLQLIAR